MPCGCTLVGSAPSICGLLVDVDSSTMAHALFEPQPAPPCKQPHPQEAPQELKQRLSSNALGTMWQAVWQETEVAARVLSNLGAFVAAGDIRAVVEREVGPPLALSTG